MRYLIVRRYIIKGMLFVLLVVALTSAIPWIYEKVFDDGARHWCQAPIQNGAWREKKGISLDTTFLNNDYVVSKLKIDDADLKGVRLSANIVVKGRFIRDEAGEVIGLSGKLFSRDIALGSNPAMKARMSFKIADDELEIESLRIGKSYEIHGRMGLASPFETDLRFDIKKLDLRGASVAARVKRRKVVLGIVDGLFHIKGRLSGNLFSEGIIKSRNGRIGPVGYDLATIRFEGFGPIINIADSSIGKGNLTMEGYVDLRDIAKGDLFDDLRIKSDMKTIVWDKWDITKEGTDELSMMKDVSDKMRVGFKTMARDPRTTYYDRENPEEMNLEYKLGGEKNLKMKLMENEEFFGIEHSVKF